MEQSGKTLKQTVTLGYSAGLTLSLWEGAKPKEHLLHCSLVSGTCVNDGPAAEVGGGCCQGEPSGDMQNRALCVGLKENERQD